jgi:hypothetical protein
LRLAAPGCERGAAGAPRARDHFVPVVAVVVALTDPVAPLSVPVVAEPDAPMVVPLVLAELELVAVSVEPEVAGAGVAVVVAGAVTGGGVTVVLEVVEEDSVTRSPQAASEKAAIRARAAQRVIGVVFIGELPVVEGVVARGTCRALNPTLGKHLLRPVGLCCRSM